MAHVIANWWYVVADIVATVRAVVTRWHTIIPISIRIKITVNWRWWWHGKIRKVKHVWVCAQIIRRHS